MIVLIQWLSLFADLGVCSELKKNLVIIIMEIGIMF